MCQNPKHISRFTSYEKIPIRQVLGEPKYNFLGRFYKGILQLLEGFRLCGTWCLSATYKFSVLPAAERSYFLWTCLAAMSKVPAQCRLGQTLPLLVWNTEVATRCRSLQRSAWRRGGHVLSLLQFARLQRGDDMAPPLRFRGPPRTVLGPEPGT